MDTSDFINRSNAEYIERLYQQYQTDPRSLDLNWQAFFAGLELVEPGVVELGRWRSEATVFPDAGEVPGMGGVGRKP